MKQIQRVTTVIDESDALLVESNSETKKSAGACSSQINVLHLDLRAARSCFHDVPVASVDRQNVTIRSDRQPKGLIQASAGRDLVTSTGTVEAE